MQLQLFVNTYLLRWPAKSKKVVPEYMNTKNPYGEEELLKAQGPYESLLPLRN